MAIKIKIPWRIMRLGDFADVNPPVNLARGKKYPFMDMANVSPLLRTIAWPEKKTFTGTGARFDEGDTLFARITPCLENGKITQARNTDSPGFGSTEFYILRGKEGVSDSDFIFYLARTYKIRKLAEQSMIGASGRQRVERMAFEDISVEVPKDLNEQRRIASILSAFDEKIENNNRIIKTLEELAQATFKEWFVKFRFPGYEKAEFVDSEMGRIPKGWEVKSLEDVVNVTIGRTPPREQSQWFRADGKGKKWVSIKDMGNSGAYIFDTSEQLTEEAVNKFNISTIPTDTVLISFKLTLGRVAITAEEMISNEAIAHLQLRDDQGLFSEFLYLFMQGINLADFGSTSSIGTAVNSKTVKRIPILVPSHEVLDEAKGVLIPLFGGIKVKTLENHKLAAMRDMLLPRLMSGEVRV